MRKIALAVCLLMFTVFQGNASTIEDNTISLNGEWSLAFWPQPDKGAIRSPRQMREVDVTTIRATVPGNVELDLLAADIIEDPMIGNNINLLRQYEGYQWCYTKVFKAPRLKAQEGLEICFGGIDCLADIWLNGELIGSTDNMFIDHRFDITDAIKSGGNNTLQVIIRSAVIEGQEKLLGPFSIRNSVASESCYIRKAPHSFGWDIMPRLPSAGIWRDVELRITQPARIENVHYYTTAVDVSNRRANIYVEPQVKLPFAMYDNLTAVCTLSRNGKEQYRSSMKVCMPAFRISMQLNDVDLWWPRGYGEPALYDAKLELVDNDGNVVASDNQRIGIRTILLVRDEVNTADRLGRFEFVINGEPIFIHGTNWVPMDGLHSRDKQHIDEAIAMAADLNCNMIRCWGGNVYEGHKFFDLCDENGIMVWQDFAMGCTFYPQRGDFQQMIEREVTSVILKLRNHPSLVLWAGNNEDDISLNWELGGFGINPNLDEVTRRTIPRIVYEFDPTRPYLPSSPYISQAIYDGGMSETLWPENHLWGPRGYYKAPFYTQARCSFVSEIGYHGCPNRESLEKMMTPDKVYPWSSDFNWNDEWQTKAVMWFPELGITANRNNLMLNQIRALFGDVPRDLDEYIFASQSVQAEAMKYFVEMWRSQKGERSGIIWWNLRDGWPIVSDAIVDYYNSKKRAYYYIRNVQHDVCIVMNDEKEGTHPLVVVNDTREAHKGSVTVTDIATGKQLFQSEYTILPNSKLQLASIQSPEKQGILKIDYTVDGKPQGNHYLYGSAPFKLEDYKNWITKTLLYND